MRYGLFCLTLLLVGCATAFIGENSFGENYGRGRRLESRTYKNYAVAFISSPPGAMIMWGETYIGDAPLTYRFTGTLKGNDSILIKAIPTQPGQCVQAQVLGLGDPLPRDVYFQMPLCSPAPKVNVEFTN